MERDKETMTSPAQKAAAEIKDALVGWAKAIGHVMPLPTTFDSLNESIIQQAITEAVDAAVAQERERCLELANIWRLRSSPATHADAAELLCASELESLVKGAE